MKLGYFSWRPGSSSENSINKSNTESDRMMKEKVSLNVNQSHKRPRKISPLLRLNSEGEITTGKNICDTSPGVGVNNKKHHNQLHLSNSFDSYTTLRRGLVDANRPFEFDGVNHIPCRPSFNKSFSVPCKSLAHQSFPPPSSSLRAINNKFATYSSNPRHLGSSEVFGVSSSPLGLQHNRCAMPSAPCDKNSDLCNNSLNCENINLVNKNKDLMQKSKDILTKSDEMNSMSHAECETTPHMCLHSDSDLNCSKSISPTLSTSMDSSKSSETSEIILVRKKKRRRPRKKRKPAQKQDCEQLFTPSSCSSPIKEKSNMDTPSKMADAADTCSRILKFVSPVICPNGSQDPVMVMGALSSSPLKPSPVKSTLVLSMPHDSDHSLDDNFSDDDLIFEDSVVFCEKELPSSESPKLQGESKKCKQKKNRSLKTSSKVAANLSSDLSDESDMEQKSSPLSNLHFTLSLTVSEDDDDNDSSVDWDSTTSPSASDQFIFEFEFNTGLSLEAIIGQNCSTDCPTSSKKLRDLNAKWNKMYSSASFDNIPSSPCSFSHQKVHFPCDEQMATIHIVGNEDRGGDWQRYALERTRFQKRIEELEKVLAPVLCESHRDLVFERIYSL